MDKFTTKWFNKWTKKVRLTNSELLQAINNLAEGLSVSNLGGHLFKVRVKKVGGGKSSGYRTIIVYKENDKAIFIYGFGKNEKQNISITELKYFKKLASDLLGLSDKQIEQSVKQKALFKLEEVQ